MHKPYFQNILFQFEGVAPVVAPAQEPETKVFEMQVEQVVQVLTASSILGKFFIMLTEFEKRKHISEWCQDCTDYKMHIHFSSDLFNSQKWL